VSKKKAASHHCHAPGCDVVVPPKIFACRAHWFALPKQVRDAVWREYREGQERDKRPSRRYMAVQTLARAYLAFKPHDEAAAYVCANLTVAAKDFRRQAIDAGDGDPFEPIALPMVQELRE
jgi:hypothetical protein